MESHGWTVDVTGQAEEWHSDRYSDGLDEYDYDYENDYDDDEYDIDNDSDFWRRAGD